MKQVLMHINSAVCVRT